MNGRVVAYFLAFVAVVVGMGAWQQACQEKEARVQLALLKTQAEILARRVEQAERLKSDQTEIAAHEKQIADQESRVRTLRQDIERLNGRYAALRQDFERDITAVRAASVGMEIGDLVLPTGVSLRKCRIQRLEDSGVFVGHELGVAMVAHQDLPKQTRDRLRYGADYVLAELKSAASAGSSGLQVVKSEAAAPPAVSANSVETTKKAEPEAVLQAERKAQQRLLEGRLAVAQMRKELQTVKEELDRLEHELTFQNPSASRRYYAGQRKTALEQQRSLLQRRLNTAEIEVLRLESGGAQ